MSGEPTLPAISARSYGISDDGRMDVLQG